MGDSKYRFDGDEFHRSVNRIYFGEIGKAVTKRKNLMAEVVYNPLHDNPEQTGIKRGSGKGVSRWVFSEDSATAEHLTGSAFNLFIDFTVEPNACIGLHFHYDKEEIYYVLEGSVAMTIVDSDGSETTEELFAGDAQFLKIGQGHYGQAGSKGARIITVCVRGIDARPFVSKSPLY